MVRTVVPEVLIPPGREVGKLIYEYPEIAVLILPNAASRLDCDENVKLPVMILLDINKTAPEVDELTSLWGG